MKLICLGEQQGEQESLQQEYKAASRRGEVRLGGSHLFIAILLKSDMFPMGRSGEHICGKRAARAVSFY